MSSFKLQKMLHGSTHSPTRTAIKDPKRNIHTLGWNNHLYAISLTAWAHVDKNPRNLAQGSPHFDDCAWTFLKNRIGKRKKNVLDWYENNDENACNFFYIKAIRLLCK